MNTYQSISKSLTSYESFVKMIYARHKAGYEDNKRLNEFVVLGSYYLDTCGNCLKAFDECRPLTRMPDMPQVLTKDEFSALMSTLPEDQQRFSWGFNSELPPANNVCSHCGQPWTLDTCYDIRKEKNSIVFPLKDFIGKPLKTVIKWAESITDKVWRVQACDVHMLIRNDKYIDLTPDPEYKSLKVNGRGWVGKKEGITVDHIIEEGDEAYINEWKYFHPECMREVISARLKEQMKDIQLSYTYLPNLAGSREADLYVKAELKMAGIKKIPYKSKGEVPTKYAGTLGKFKFWRAWRYWVVEGPVPLDIAIKMYDDPEGQKSVRVAGHCGCPHPTEWAYSQNTVEFYHIDTLQGLQLFTRSVEPIACA